MMFVPNFKILGQVVHEKSLKGPYSLYILLKKVLHHLNFTTFLSNILYKYIKYFLNIILPWRVGLIVCHNNKLEWNHFVEVCKNAFLW